MDVDYCATCSFIYILAKTVEVLVPTKYNSKVADTNTFYRTIFNFSSHLHSGQGYSPVFGRAVKKCCWKCAKCESGYVKPSPGLQQCTKCNSSQAPNPEHTECIPFTVSKLQYDTTEGEWGLTVLRIHPAPLLDDHS